MKRFIPIAILLLATVWVLSTLRAPKNKTDFDLRAFGETPVLVNGRVKPLDTVARTSLLMFQNRQRVSTPEISTPFVNTPSEWLADVFFVPAKADTYPTFKIDSPEVLDLFGITAEQTKVNYSGPKRILAILGFIPASKSRFSFNQLAPKLGELEKQAQLADPVPAQSRTPFQRGVLELYRHLVEYQKLKSSVQLMESTDFLADLKAYEAQLPAGIAAAKAQQSNQPHDEAALKVASDFAMRFEFLANAGQLLVIPPDPGETVPTAWKKMGDGLLDSFATGKLNPFAETYAALGHAWRNNEAGQFNTLVTLYHADLAKRFPAQIQKSDIEERFNQAQPFYTAMSLFVWVFLLAIFSWLRWPDALSRSAFYLMGLAAVLTTIGLVARMWIEGRPPVTNLYSSAVFVAWTAVVICLVLEAIFKNAIASVAGAMIGFAGLLIAHHLSLSGDTMEMMRAVLDSNFWLATHVVVITLGYGATFLAGFLAIIYIVRGVATRSLDKNTADALYRMVYGIVCFATLFSLVGTVLGGIWADQSWGRFWGWDPKENGALLIVLWNAIILHCRWGGLVKPRGFMALAVFGNIVTSWSWFGTNMLGVGLHSYGFMDSAFYALIAFVASQLAIMAIAAIPLEKWRSFAPVGK